MKPGSVKIVDRVSAVEAIKRLGEEDLLFLNRLIVERLKFISQEELAHALWVCLSPSYLSFFYSGMQGQHFR